MLIINSFMQVTLTKHFLIPIFPDIFKQGYHFTFYFPVMLTQRAKVFLMKGVLPTTVPKYVKCHLFPKEPLQPLGNYAYCYWPWDRVISHEPRGRELSVPGLQFMNVKKKNYLHERQKNKAKKFIAKKKQKQVFWQGSFKNWMQHDKKVEIKFSKSKVKSTVRAETLTLHCKKYIAKDQFFLINCS